MRDQNQYGGLGKDHVCPVCGKTFSVPFQTRGGGRTQWAYTRRKKGGNKTYLCSYSCTGVWDAEKETGKKLKISWKGKGVTS